MAVPSVVGSSVQAQFGVTGSVTIGAPGGTVGNSLLLAFAAVHNHTADYPSFGFTESRVDPPAGWTYLGGVRQFLDDLEDFFLQVWFRFIPSDDAPSEPPSYSFTPAVYDVDGDLDRGPNGQPIQPTGIILSLVRYNNIDVFEPIDNVSYDTGAQSTTDPLDEVTTTTTNPPVVRAPQALLARFSVIDVLSSFSSSAGMTELLDVANSGSPAYEQLTAAISHESVATGIPVAKTLTWGSNAHWADMYIVVRGSGSPTSLPIGWSLIDDYTVGSTSGEYFEHRVVASRYDNFLYWVNQADAGSNAIAYKANRTTGEITLQVDLGLKFGSPVPMEVSATSFYVGRGNTGGTDTSIRRYNLSFVLQATSPTLGGGTVYFYDLVLGKAASVGKLWVLYFNGVRRIDETTLTTIDEVAGPTWANFGVPYQGVVDASGNLWVVSSISARSWIVFIDGVTMAATGYEISDDFPGTAIHITYWEPENSLYVSDSRTSNDLFEGAESKLGRWSISTQDFTHFFRTDKLIGSSHSGFKYGPSQCVIPLGLSSRSGSYEFCLPPDVTSEVALLCTDDLAYKRSFPIKTQVAFPSIPDNPGGLGTIILETIFDAAQSPDYLWAAFADPLGFTFQLGFLNTNQTIDCCTEEEEENIPLPQAESTSVFCIPKGLPWRGRDFRVLPMPKLR